MTAVACLRVDVTGHCDRMPMATLAPLVQKFAGAYLETRWSWPRRFFTLTEFSFLLIDPRSDELDVEELRRLSDELQRHLFGASDEGEVALLVFEGTHAAVTEFAGLDADAVAAAVADPSRLPAGGRLTRIVSGTAPAPAAAAPSPPTRPAARPAATSGMEWEPAPAPTPAAAPPQVDSLPSGAAWEGVQGVYFMPRQVFFGDVVTYIPANGRTHLGILDGPEHRPRDPTAFDAACVGMAARLLAQRPKGSLIYVPMSFTSLVRPSLRGAYEKMFAELPTERRGELAAAIYDVPRDPGFAGLKQARGFLGSWFSVVDLCVADPGFEIEKLPPDVATSVTLTLPDGDSYVRLSALRRFAERLIYFKQKRVWPGVTNIRRRAELEAAQRLHIPFVTGSAVCAPVPSPVGGRNLPLERLPMALAEWMDIRPRQRDAMVAAGPAASSASGQGLPA